MNINLNKTIIDKNFYSYEKWFLIDAKNKTLGRIATQISNLLLGKNTSLYYPGQKLKAFVIVINAQNISVSGNKYKNKIYYKHSGMPGGLKKSIYKDLIQRIPERIIEKAVWGMVPKTHIGRNCMTRLKVFKNEDHNIKNKQLILI